MQFAQAMDPLHFVQVRNGAGGVAPAATAALLDDLQTGINDDLAWLVAAQTRLANAMARRTTAVAALTQ